MFEGLNEIDWAELTHAYGAAEDVPAQIRSLVDGDAPSAISAFFGNIYHQGTVYSATVAAVPFLIEAFDHVDQQTKIDLLTLLSVCSIGHGYYDVHSRSPLVLEPEDGSLGDVISDEIDIVVAVTRAVYGAWDIAEACLDDSVELQVAATELLANLAYCDSTPTPTGPQRYQNVRPSTATPGEYRDRAVSRFEQRWHELASDGNGDAPTTLLKANYLAALDRVTEGVHDLFHQSFVGESTPIENVVLLQALLKQDKPSTARLAELLNDVVNALPLTLPDHFSPWFLEDYHSWLLVGFRALDDDAFELIADTFVTYVSKTEPTVFLMDLTLLLQAALGNPIPAVGEERCMLSEGRRRVVEALLKAPTKSKRFWLWEPSNGNAKFAFRNLELPEDRAVWQKWLVGST